MALVTSALVFSAGADTAFISTPLQRTGADPNASGLVTIDVALNTSSMVVQATNLTPRRTYTVSSGGIVRGTFVANASGRGQLRFAQPQTAGSLPFNFDPRGKQLLISLNGTPVLGVLISAIGEPLGSTVNEQVTLTPLAGTIGAANAAYQLLPTGVRRFSVTLTNLPNSDWALYVDGVRRGNIPVRGGGGRIAFDNLPATPDRALNFDPRGAVIDLVRGETIGFSSRFAARANGLNVANPSIQTRFIPSSGLTTLGLARVQLRTERDARRVLDVSLQNVPAGAYDLFINNVLRGSIAVLTSGQLSFCSDPADEDELPLNFNPFTSTYLILLADTPVFLGQPVRSDLIAINQGLPTIAETLTATGLDADASGTALFQLGASGAARLLIETRDLPAGLYGLWVNGLLRDTMTVEPTPDGRTLGALDLAGDLGFEPRGSVVELRSPRGVFFSHLLGAGNGGLPPARLELPLLNLGRDPDGTARVMFTRGSQGERHFEAVLRNVPDGDYALLVDDIPVAFFTVSNVRGGTRGEVEFEDFPELGELLLTFDPLGREIAIERDSTRYFQRILPLTP